MKKLAAIVFFTSFGLILLGLILVMSASSTYSEVRFDSLYFLFNSHLGKVVAGLFFLVIFSAIPYDFYRDIGKILLLISIMLLIATLLFAPEYKGAARWINLGIITFQPADPARLALIIFLAAFIEDRGKEIQSFREGYRPAMIWISIIIFLILLQPNFSTAVLLLIVSLAILHVGGASMKHTSLTVFSGLGAGAVMALFIFSHAKARIFSYINAYFSGGEHHLQVKQALFSLGSGGILGVGLGHSRQSNLFLPEAYGDFIFAILGEELGFLGTTIVLSSYLILFISGILIAKKAKDTFGQLLAFGITFSITLYAFINIAVVTGIVPTTGLPLPFISYGGSSIVFTCISVGILVNIAIQSAREEVKLSPKYVSVDKGENER